MFTVEQDDAGYIVYFEDEYLTHYGYDECVSNRQAIEFATSDFPELAENTVKQ